MFNADTRTPALISFALLSFPLTAVPETIIRQSVHEANQRFRHVYDAEAPRVTGSSLCRRNENSEKGEHGKGCILWRRLSGQFI